MMINIKKVNRDRTSIKSKRNKKRINITSLRIKKSIKEFVPKERYSKNKNQFKKAKKDKVNFKKVILLTKAEIEKIKDLMIEKTKKKITTNTIKEKLNSIELLQNGTTMKITKEMIAEEMT